MFDYIKNRDGKKIFAVFNYPRGNGPFSAVLIIHGFKGFSDQRHLQVISAELVEKGFLTLRPDLTKNPGRGYLEFADMTYRQELADVEDCLEYLLKMNEVNSDCVGVAGHSLAGMITAELASTRQEVKALAILSGVYAFDLIAGHIFKKPYQRAKKDFNQKGWTFVWSDSLTMRLKIKRTFYEDIVKRTADDFAGDIKCPTLVVSSGTDESVSQVHADNWMKKLGTNDQKMEIIEGSDHNYSGESLDKVSTIVANWFVTKLI